MKKLLLAGAVLTAGALGLQDVSVGHGGTYRGPGDTVPPGGGGGGGGGGPSTPGPAGPSTPGGSGPSTPGPGGPGTPGAGPGGPAQPTTGGGGETGPDLTTWQYWWGFNKDPYLNLKAHIHSDAVQTGSDDFYLGHGQTQVAKDSFKPTEKDIREKIAPALERALKAETNNDIVTACLIALAKIGDVKSEEGVSRYEGMIKEFLKNSVQEIRETAAVSLGILANPASIPLLTHLLLDTADGRREVNEPSGVNYRTRAFAAYGLALIGWQPTGAEYRKQIVETLWTVCEEPRSATRDVKVAAVLAMGLVPLDFGTAEQVAAAEARKPSEKVVPTTREEQIAYLLAFFADDNNSDRPFLVRAHAPRSVALLLEGAPKALKEKAVDQFLPYAGKSSEGQPEVRQSAILALGLLGDLDDDKQDVKIRAELIESLGNADAQVKNFSVIALGQIGGRPGDGDNPMFGLKEINDHLTKNLARSGGRVKPWLGLAVGVMQRSLLDANQSQNRDALAALRATLAAEKSPSDVGAYALALGVARDLESEQVLIEKLDAFAEDGPRGDVAIALGLMNSVRSKETIQEIVKKSKYRRELLQSAAIALGLLGDKNVVTELLGMLKTEAKTLSTQAAVAHALGFIGDARSIDPLVAMLEDRTLTDGARAFAGVALGIVADKEPLPWNSKISVDMNYRASTLTLSNFGQGTGILDIL
jgi:HEAT repeat protein